MVPLDRSLIKALRTLDGARAWIAETLVASYWAKGHGLWAVERRSDGELVGMCGLLERDTLPTIDVGYACAAHSADKRLRA